MIKANNLVTQVYDELRRRIVEYEFEANSPLVISRLATEFSISPTPVREALARLHAEGLARFSENIGYSVAPAPNYDDYKAWMKARQILEVGALRIVSHDIPENTIKRLSDINRRILSASFGVGENAARGFSEINSEFHRELIQLCDNQYLIRAYEDLWRTARFSRLYANRGVVYQQRIVEEHERVIGALKDGDFERASQALSDHIGDSITRDEEDLSIDHLQSLRSNENSFRIKSSKN